MRDRETDSWWSIMTSTAIGGALDGSELVELPVGEKAQWGDWRSRHPNTLVLSVDGVQHIPENHYDEYFASGGTFRDLLVEDQRLPPKEPIFGGWIDGRPQAVPHFRFEGGAVLELSAGRRLLLYRPDGASIFASSRVYLLPSAPEEGATAKALLERIDAGELAAQPVSGFDTFWYSWVTVNTDSAILD
jgi:hypothetical protein